MVAEDDSNKSCIERAFDRHEIRENNLLREAIVGEKNEPAKLRYQSRSANETARYLLLVSAMEQKGRALGI